MLFSCTLQTSGTEHNGRLHVTFALRMFKLDHLDRLEQARSLLRTVVTQLY